MASSGISCFGWRLYIILDADAAVGRALPELAEAAVRGGANVIQLRGKRLTARELIDLGRRCLAVTRPAGVPLIINDRADVANAVGADGVHLGQDDLPVDAVRQLLGAGRLVGKSTHSLEQARAGQAEGADYIGCGPVFATPTKPNCGAVGLELVQAVTGEARVPVVCIGGIDTGNVEAVLEAGARCVAVVRAFCAASDPESAARQLKQTLEQFHRTTPAPRI